MTMIYPDNIYLDVSENSCEDILKLIGKLLYKNGYVKETYSDALLAREEYSPTGLPTCPYSIAIPHTDPEHVIKPCIIILKLKEPVLFREMGNPVGTVQVKYVFGLVFTDGKKQVPLLSQMISMTQNEEDMDTLINATDRKVILEVVKKYIY
ncbi:MAG: PTS sugar transporter subunit IIA [Eubacteriales bacterium]